MKRLVISLLILLLLTTAGFSNTAHLNTITDTLSQLLEEAESAGESGDWERARETTQTAQEYWQRSAAYLYIVLRHDYTDDVNTGFSEVLELIEWEETPEYAAANGELIAQVEHLSEAEQLTLKNLL